MVRAAALGLACLALGSALMIAEAAAQATGTIVGSVMDASTGRPIAEAGVEIIGEQITARTDANGYFSISVKPGIHELRVFAPFYEGTRVRDVKVTAGQETRADARLTREVSSGDIEIIEVVAEVRQADEATQILQRQKAAVVSDTISAQLIKKSPDSDAAEIVQRIPAVTLQDDRFLVVRGLGDRYSSAVLNGSRLPSTDPDKRVVSLDLFPAGFIDSLNVIKSFTPDLPGDFSGGLVDIQLKDIPQSLTWSLGVTTGANTQTTFQDFDTYKGSDLDVFGFGADYRALPGRIPDGSIRNFDEGAQQRFFASGFRNIWDVDQTTAPPNYAVSLSGGNAWGPVGVALATTFSNEYKFRQEFRGGFANTALFEQGQEISFTYNRSLFETKLGAVAVAGWEIAADHKLSARGFVNRETDDEVLDGAGQNPLLDPDLEITSFPTQLGYREDQLGYGQFAGFHRLSRLEVDWRTAISQTTRCEPDTRQYEYSLNPSIGPRPRLDTTGDIRRLFSNLDEWLWDSAIDFTLPFETGLPFTSFWSGLDARFKTGVGYLLRKRDFEFRRFQYDLSTSNTLDTTLSPEILLAPQFVGLQNGVQFIEATQLADSFDAKQDIASIYAMLDTPLIEDRLRLISGVRVEYSYIDTNGASASQNLPVSTQINDLDPLPGINLVYTPIEIMNVRLGYSRTVSRPEFRELTPTMFPVPGGERTVVGNQDLITAHITNYDLRWEWFSSTSDLLSASFFYKELKDPIEKIGLGLTSSLADTFRNADDATIWGFELEARTDLRHLSPVVEKIPHLDALGPELYNVFFSANAAFAESEVNISDAGVSTNRKRALQGQPDFVVNASIEYRNDYVGTMRMLYNTIGQQIAAAGAEGLPDIFLERRDQLDFVWTRNFELFGEEFNGKFTVENILNDQFIETQGEFSTLRYVTGIKFGIGISYSY